MSRPFVLERLRARFEVVEYGLLDYAPDPYPLFAIRSRDWRDERPHVLVTGGVHGYETSGAGGGLRGSRQPAGRALARSLPPPRGPA